MNESLHKIYKQLYKSAGSAENLPWHRDEPPFLLKKAAQARNPGEALDIGCGAGLYSIWLAQNGYRVTGIDFLDEALDLARHYAREAKASIELHRTDVLDWNPGKKFDLILDSGCFHTLRDIEHQKYLENIHDWLEPGGDYLLVHFGKRNIFDWRPFGPARRTKNEIEKIFSKKPIPGLSMIGSFSEVSRTTFMLGPRVQIITCWFRKD